MRKHIARPLQTKGLAQHHHHPTAGQANGSLDDQQQAKTNDEHLQQVHVMGGNGIVHHQLV